MVKHLRSRKRNNKSLRRSLRKNTKRRSLRKRKTRSTRTRKSRRLTHKRKNSKRRSTRRKNKYRKLKGSTRSSLTLNKSDLQDFTFNRDREGNLVIQSIDKGSKYVQLMNYSKGSGEYPKVIQIMKGEEIIMEEGSNITNKELRSFRDSIKDKDVVITLEIEDYRPTPTMDFSELKGEKKERQEKLKKEAMKHSPQKMKKAPRKKLRDPKKIEEEVHPSKNFDDLIDEIQEVKGSEITEAEIDQLVKLLESGKSIEDIHELLIENDFAWFHNLERTKGDDV